MDFVVAGTAAVTAGFFTNPLEVVKTRLQLQGELKAKGHHAVHYNNFFHAGFVIARNDGILALQAGLVPALVVQFIMNGMRLGFYEFAHARGFFTDEHGNLIFYKNVLVGGVGGVFGQLFSSPFFLIKTHLQSQAAQSIAVGHQHKHTGMCNGLKMVYVEQGMKGLFRGAVASVPRAFVGSTSQITSFAYSKEWLQKYNWFPNSPIFNSFLASMVGGVAISIAMNPFDLVLTRIYNQGVNAKGEGLLYRGYMDCVIKVFKTEGFQGFYKGIGPTYLRLGPHTVLCFVFWDIYKDFYERFTSKTEIDVVS